MDGMTFVKNAGRCYNNVYIGLFLLLNLMSQVLVEKEKTTLPKLSAILQNCTEEQCSGKFISMDDRGNKKYCALGVAALYAGKIS